MFEVIQEIKPTWVVGENVYGIVNWDGGMVFDQVQSDLEAEGYEVQAVIIPACAVNAPHRRDRVWFVAKSCDKRCNDRSDNREERYIQKNKRTAEKDQSEREGRECGAGEISSTSSDTKCIRCEQCEQQEQSRCRQTLFEGVCNNGDVTDTRSVGRESGTSFRKQIPREEGRPESDLRNKTSDATNSKRSSSEGKLLNRQEKGESGRLNSKDATNTSNQGLQGGKDERITKRERKDRNKQLTRPFCTNWDNFPTQPPVRGRNDGLSSRLVGITFPKWRNESIKALGNSIVPQVALEIFKVIEEYENQPKNT